MRELQRMPLADSLPDDIDALKALLAAREAELAARDGVEAQLRQTIDTLTQSLHLRGLEIQQLTLQIAKLKRMQFGRKNFLFMGAHSGGERAAAMYSLIGSCKLNGIEPEGYLRHVLTHIADHPNNRVDELLPWNIERQAH